MIHNDIVAIQAITFRQIKDLTRRQLESFDIQFSERRLSEVIV